MEWFRIDWNGPYSIDTADKRKEAGTFGVYAIYEQKNKSSNLMYIGKTYWQGFGKRLQQHRRQWLHRLDGKVTIHFGVVVLPQGKKISYERVSDIEEFMIHYYHPLFNTASKKGYRGRDILIFNTGKIGTLDKMTSDDKELLKLIKKSLLQK